jgi:hypothetical protein
VKGLLTGHCNLKRRPSNRGGCMIDY